MARKPKTWAEKMKAPAPHLARLERNYGGMMTGEMMLISSPQEVASHLKAHVKRGHTITVPELRAGLAKEHGAAGVCPMSTGIFLRIASEAARFGSVFIKAGFSSMDMGTSYLLPKIVGAGAAREMMLTGRIIDAAEAYRIQLVHEVAPADQLLEAALRMARSIRANNSFGVWQTKIGLNAALDATSLRHAKELENRIQIMTSFTNNPREAAAALMEKRDPVWDPM